MTEKEIEDKARALWEKDYPGGGSLYKSYESLPNHDKELYRAIVSAEETPNTMRITCPDCKGNRTVIAFVDGPKYRGSQEIPCFCCKGAGHIDEAHANRKRLGNKMRDERIDRGESIYACAQRLGITPSELSAKERGDA